MDRGARQRAAFCTASYQRDTPSDHPRNHCEALPDPIHDSHQASQFGIYTSQVTASKKQLMARVTELLADGRQRRTEQATDDGERYEQIGRLKMEVEWLKKKLPRSAEVTRRCIGTQAVNSLATAAQERAAFHRTPDCPKIGGSTSGLRLHLQQRAGSRSMSKRKKPTSFAAIRVMLHDVEDLVDGGKWSLDRKAAARWRRRPWGGAKVIICETLPARARASYTHVVSPYVVELSWLIDMLKNICSGFVDYRNKEAFYGRLADAANRYLSQRLPKHHNPKDVCFAVVREALRMVEEADRGTLSAARNEVRIKHIWVQLHPGGSDSGAGLALYWIPANLRKTLANEPFVFRDKHYRIGESTEMIPSGDEVMHMAEYHED